MKLKGLRNTSKVEKDCHNCSTRIPYCHSFCLIYLDKLANKKDKPEKIYWAYASDNVTKRIRKERNSKCN